MRKKIILNVDQLIHKNYTQEKQQKHLKKYEKLITFEQMYEKARLHNNNQYCQQFKYNLINSTYPFPKAIQSLKISRKTPENTRRNRQRGRVQKLNRSLEAKSSSLQKQGDTMMHEEKPKQMVQKWKLQKRQIGQQKKNEQIGEWREKQQFKEEYSKIIKQLNHSCHEHLRQIQCFLSIEEVFGILKRLHYLRKVEDEKYLIRIWKKLEGETYGGIPRQNLFEFLTYINHYRPEKLLINKHTKGQKLHIDNNLKLVVSEEGKQELYEQFLNLRVNRILYGQKQSESNIKIIDETQVKQNLPFKKKQIKNSVNKSERSIIKLKRTNQKGQEKPQEEKKQKVQFVQKQQKQQSEETVCHSQFSQSKQSNKVLNSNESEGSLQSEVIEEIVIKKPILTVDVNLGDGFNEKLVVFEGETAFQVSQRLVKKYNIDETLRVKFQNLLNNHMRNLLWRIEQVSEEMFSDREE